MFLICFFLLNQFFVVASVGFSSSSLDDNFSFDNSYRVHLYEWNLLGFGSVWISLSTRIGDENGQFELEIIESRWW